MADEANCDNCGKPLAEHGPVELELGVPVNDLRALVLGSIFAAAVLSGVSLEEAKAEVTARLDANHGGLEGLEKVIDDAQAAISHGMAVLRAHTARNN